VSRWDDETVDERDDVDEADDAPDALGRDEEAALALAALDVIADDEDGLSEEARAELEAVADAEEELNGALEEALAEAQQALAAQRAATRAAVARYREALLAADGDLPPDLVHGDTLEEIDASVSAARQAVAQIRERLTAEARAIPSRGFPVGSPARTPHTSRGLTPAEKIAAGLSERYV